MLLSTADAARRMSITRDGVLKLIERGLLPATKVGRDWVILESDLKEYEKSRRNVGRPPNK